MNFVRTWHTYTALALGIITLAVISTSPNTSEARCFVQKRDCECGRAVKPTPPKQLKLNFEFAHPSTVAQIQEERRRRTLESNHQQCLDDEAIGVDYSLHMSTTSTTPDPLATTLKDSPIQLIHPRSKLARDLELACHVDAPAIQSIQDARNARLAQQRQKHRIKKYKTLIAGRRD